VWGFLKKSLNIVSGRMLLLIVLNWVFFGVMIVGVFFEEAGFAGVLRWPVGEEAFTVEIGDAVLLLVSVFFTNLVLSGFVLVTLTGLGFFGLPLFFLCLRAFFWGFLLSRLSTPLFLAAFPTLILEGEGYVLAALGGVVLGLSWLRPRLVYPREELSRSEAVRRAFKECAHIYILVALILFAAAVVEIVTLVVV